MDVDGDEIKNSTDARSWSGKARSISGRQLETANADKSSNDNDKMPMISKKFVFFIHIPPEKRSSYYKGVNQKVQEVLTNLWKSLKILSEYRN